MQSVLITCGRPVCILRLGFVAAVEGASDGEVYHVRQAVVPVDVGFRIKRGESASENGNRSGSTVSTCQWLEAQTGGSVCADARARVQ
jgi:hypothetical protein